MAYQGLSDAGKFLQALPTARAADLGNVDAAFAINTEAMRRFEDARWRPREAADAPAIG